jgi:hypothetical protein
MLSDQAATFPQLYQKYSEYLQSRLTGDVLPLPKYRVPGKEFGELTCMSSVINNMFGRIIYHTKCDSCLSFSPGGPYHSAVAICTALA